MLCALPAVFKVREVRWPVSLRKRLLNCLDDGGIGLHAWLCCLTFQIRRAGSVEEMTDAMRAVACIRFVRS